MPPRTKKRASATEEYESDGGFVAPESGDDAPKSKKAKTGKSSAPANLAGSKDAQDGQTVAGGGSVSANGEVFWEVCSPLSASMASRNSHSDGEG